MKEYYIFSNSFGCPFSDSDSSYVIASSPRKALENFSKSYKHPAGLYFAACWGSADDEKKGREALAQWHCNVLKMYNRMTKGKSSFSALHSKDGGGEFLIIDDKKRYIKNPKEGSVVRGGKEGKK